MNTVQRISELTVQKDTFLMLVDSISEMVSRLGAALKERYQVPAIDAEKRLKSLYRLRNQPQLSLGEGDWVPRLRDLHPQLAVLSYSEASEDFDYSDLWKLQFRFLEICLELAVRHHLRGRAHKAVTYIEAVSGLGYMLFDEVTRPRTPEVRPLQRAKIIVRRRAASGGLAKSRNDPRSREKQFVRECWQEWRRDPDRYKSKAEFARQMLDKCEHLTSQKKIEDWCREWEKKEPC